MPARLILVGGFLGAGKTTLLLQAAKRLAARGLRVGLVTNDQGNDLVDTALAARQQIPVSEVAGGCFCCRFPDLMASLERLHEAVQPDVVLAEPVGSCTDLMATVLLPLHRYYPDLYEVAPLTVLADAERDPAVFSGPVGYLYHQQLAEAEILALNKADVLDGAARSQRMGALQVKFPTARVVALSARTGEGLEEWLELALGGVSRFARVLDVDYGAYAEAEASLGWLNARVAVRAAQPFAADEWLRELLQGLAATLEAQGATIAHLKAQVVAPAVQLKASVTRAGKPLYWDMWSPHAETDRAQLVLNARVECAPAVLEAAARGALARVRPGPGAVCEVVHLDCFQPAPPQPTHRLAAER